MAGRGRSDWLGSALEYSFPQLLADLNALVARLGVERVDLVGTSMGGLLGMLLAASPGSPVRRLVMNDVGAFLPGDALARIARHLRAPARFASLDAVEAHVRATRREWGELTDAQWRHFARHAARREGDGYRLHYDPRIGHLLGGALPLSPGISFWDAWYRVRCPVLLLRGEESQILPRSVADTMLAARPAAQLVEIPGCGHAPALVSAEQIEMVGEFLSASEGKKRKRPATFLQTSTYFRNVARA